MHSTLFAATMAALGLDPTYGAYLDRLPGATLATVNLVSMFGLHRRWRAALVGHLAVFEMTSVEPMERYSRALARMGIGPEGRRFYDVHVAADARHGVIALERADIRTRSHQEEHRDRSGVSTCGPWDRGWSPGRRTTTPRGSPPTPRPGRNTACRSCGRPC
jgi:hypothetical protein